MIHCMVAMEMMFLWAELETIISPEMREQIYTSIQEGMATM